MKAIRLLPRSERSAQQPFVRPAHARSVITRAGERVLRKDLDRLRRKLEVDFVMRLRDARSDGEAAANDDYLQIKEEEAVIVSGIVRLEALLASATVIDETGAPTGIVVIGDFVEIEDLDSGAIDELLLTGDFERSVTQAVTASSPVGRALMGRVTGDEVEVKLPGGRERRLKVLAIRGLGSI